MPAVIVTATRRAERLESCLDALVAQRRTPGCPSFETIVVLHGVGDREREALAAERPEARVVGSEVNLGLAPAC